MPIRIRIRLVSTAGVISALACLMLASTGIGATTESTDLLPDLPPEAKAEAVLEDGVAQIEARLLVSASPVPAIGVLFQLADGWHLYWRNPGETGIAPELRFETPGHAVGDLIWPPPQRYEEGDGLFTTYGYEDSVLLSAPLARQAAPETEETPDEPFGVEADVLICRTECIPVSFSLTSPRAPRLPLEQQARVDALFAATRAIAPVRLEDLGLAGGAHWSGPDRIRLDVEIPSVCGAPRRSECPLPPEADDDPLFLPIDTERLEITDVRLIEAGTGFELELAVTTVSDPEPGKAFGLHGLVPIRTAGGERRYVEVKAGVAVGGDLVAESPLATWAVALLFALIGGLILNGMPCVLPVLAIKIVAVADLADRDRREIHAQGLAYTAGVLGSMAVLAVGVIALRAAGHSVGWGFQFQEPLFVAVISAVVVAFALNLFGVFEIHLGEGRLASLGPSLGQRGSNVRRSLFEGLLAVVLATPCTAPFLGTAVGFAFAAPDAGILVIFLAIGLGLALPFLLVSFVPGLARFVPRSGPWMLKLRAGLGWALLATAAWLLWILGRSGGADAIAATLAVLLALSFLLWVYGQLQPLRRVWAGRMFALSIAALALAGLNSIGFDRATERGSPAESGGLEKTGDWEPWSGDAVARALADGRPSFVVFTADWCLTCQVNERTVLARDDVREAFRQGGYALFKADWTHRDESIRRELARFDRAGVPLYLVYSPDAPDRPRVLSELLSRREVLTAITFSSNAVADQTMQPPGMQPPGDVHP